MKLTQAILPVAGLGTRFLPWTKVVPKELLPIGRLPIIAWLVDECLSVGIREICFVISRGKELIPAFFETDRKLEAELRKRGKSDLLHELARYHEVRFETVYQHEQLGDGHAILQAKGFVKSDHVVILFGDDVIAGEHGSGLEQLVRQESAIRGQVSGDEWALLCLQEVPREQVARYGIAAVVSTKERLKRIAGLIEKPTPEQAPSTLAVVGKYVIPRSLFQMLEKIGECPEVDASRHFRTKEIRLIDALIAALPMLPVYGYVFEGRRFDAGTPEGYREAVKTLG